MCAGATPQQSQHSVESISDEALVHAEALLGSFDPTSPAKAKATDEVERRGIDRTPYLNQQVTPENFREATAAERDLGEDEGVVQEQEFIEEMSEALGD